MATLQYKGYVGVVEVDDEANLLHGQIANTRDVITFQGRTVKELQKALKESVDDYLEFCKSRGEEPEKPFSGKFMVRVDPSLHRELTIAAAIEGKSVQTVVREAIQQRVALDEASVEGLVRYKIIGGSMAVRDDGSRSSKGYGGEERSTPVAHPVPITKKRKARSRGD